MTFHQLGTLFTALLSNCFWSLCTSLKHIHFPTLFWFLSPLASRCFYMFTPISFSAPRKFDVFLKSSLFISIDCLSAVGSFLLYVYSFLAVHVHCSARGTFKLWLNYKLILAITELVSSITSIRKGIQRYTVYV